MLSTFIEKDISGFVLKEMMLRLIYIYIFHLQKKKSGSYFIHGRWFVWFIDDILFFHVCVFNQKAKRTRFLSTFYFIFIGIRLFFFRCKLCYENIRNYFYVSGVVFDLAQILLFVTRKLSFSPIKSFVIRRKEEEIVCGLR